MNFEISSFQNFGSI